MYQKNKTNFSITFIAVTLMQLLVSHVAFSQSSNLVLSHEDSDFHYIFNLPDGWIEIDQNVLESSSSGTFSIGFRREDSSQYIYPYMLIEQERIQTTFSKLSEPYYNIDISENKNSEPTVNEAIYEDLKIDIKTKNILLEAATMVDEVGKIKMLSSTYLGKNGVVQLHFYSIYNEFNEDVSEFMSILNSFKFQEGYEADDIMGSIVTKKRQSFLYVLSKMAVGALIGVSFCYMIAVIRKRK